MMMNDEGWKYIIKCYLSDLGKLECWEVFIWMLLWCL